MSGIQCEICGGQIEMQSGGSKGICVQCGITYSADRVRELYSGKRTPVTSGGNAAYTEFDIRDGVLVKYNGRKEKVVVPYGVKIIGELAFYENGYVTEVVLPETVSRIDRAAFQWTKSLKIINLTDKIKTIGNEAFKWSALENITIPPISVLGEDVFYGCESLVSVEFSDGVREIGKNAFAGCVNLSNVLLPNTLETIEAQAFCGCNNLTSANLTKNIKYIGEEAFAWCGLECVKIMSKEVFIGDNAFRNCDNLTSVNITGNIVFPEFPQNYKEAFLSCGNVIDVTCKESFVEKLFNKTELENMKRMKLNGKIYVPESLKKDRKRKGTCQYCGGPFKGVFSKVCSQCGTPKDY